MRLGGDFFSFMISPLFLPIIKTSPPTIARESNGWPGASLNIVTKRAERESSVVLLVSIPRRLIADTQSHPPPEAATTHEPLDVGSTWAVTVRPPTKANTQSIGKCRIASPLYVHRFQGSLHLCASSAVTCGIGCRKTPDLESRHNKIA